MDRWIRRSEEGRGEDRRSTFFPWPFPSEGNEAEYD